MIDLNDLIPSNSGWMLADAKAINDSGQIVGYGFDINGEQHAFLLTPIPEPSTLALLSLAFISFLAFAWRQVA